MLFLTSPLFLFKRNSTLLPGIGVIVWDRLTSLVKILFMTKLLSLDPLSWDMDCLLTLWPSSSLVLLVTVTVRLIFWYLSLTKEYIYRLYILTEKSLKHLCSIRDWVPVSFFLSLSHSGWLLGAQNPVLLTLLPGLLRLSWEGTLCLHASSRGCPVPSWEMQVLCQGLYWFSA